MKNLKAILICSMLVWGIQNLLADDCFKLQGSKLQTSAVGQLFVQSDTLDISRRDFISGFAISGQITKSSPEYVVRVIMTDSDGKEHLVMELYEEINSDSVFSFTDYCEETAILNGVCPSTLKVYLKDATLRITQTTVANARSKRTADRNFEVRCQSLRQNQTSAIIDKINAYNIANNRLWRAGETALTQYDNAERRKRMFFAKDMSSGGFEYYAGGIFEMGHGQPEQQRNSLYVDDFDWRDRHGINWMTPVRDQGYSFFCTAFAALGCVEALVNLYYNQKLDLDLSEQELASCADSVAHFLFSSNINHMGVDIGQACDYLINHGVCDEASFPFSYTNDSIPCISDEITPMENIKVSGVTEYLPLNADGYKSTLISKGPIWVASFGDGSIGHAMALVGYHTIKAGDYIHFGNSNTFSNIGPGVTIGSNDTHIGSTYWVFKDSYGDSFHSPNGGYYYISFPVGYLVATGYPRTFNYPIISQNLTSNDIVWEDRDGDGLYNWGIGPKPASCPSWVPSSADGDDSDPTKGYCDSSGHCYDFDPENHAFTINDVQTYNNVEHLSRHMTITTGGVLTVTDRLHCIGNPVITLDGTGELIIDGGYIYNAELNLSSTSKLTIKNGGRISIRRGKSFSAPVGAVVTITNGSIDNM